MRKGGKKKKGEPKWYFKSIWKGGELSYVPYEWIEIKKEQYEKICLSVPHWCGIPTDVDWAMATNSYREAQMKKLKGE